jgi:hypothetical protein
MDVVFEKIGKHLVDGLGDFHQSHSVVIVKRVGKRTLAYMIQQ